VIRRWGFGVSLTAVSFGAGLLRVGYVLAFRRDDVPMGNDSFFFSQGANLLAQGRGFINPYVALSGTVEQAADHPPLYTLWLAVASVLDPGRDTSQLTHMLWSCVLGAGTVAVCGLVGRRLAGPRAGIVAAVGAALYPNLWLHDTMLMSESMSILTVSLVIWSAYRFWDDPGAARVAVLGLCCGLAALTRSELALTVPVVLVPAVLVRGAARGWGRRLRLLAVGGGVAAATLAPWVGYNQARFDEPVYMSTNFAVTMAAANCDSTYFGERLGYKDWNCAVAAHEKAIARTPGWAELDASERDQRLRPEVVHYIRDHERRVPVVAAARIGRILKLYGVRQEIEIDSRDHGHERAVVYAGLVTWYVGAGLAAVGVVVLRRRRVPVFPLLAVPAIVLVSVAFTFAQTRYRAPAEPAVVVLAAVTVDAWLRRRSAAPARVDEPAEPAGPAVPTPAREASPV
jgi:4-amino-4-deoxy-L-arabinose transferase-like glycosyltransferase